MTRRLISLTSLAFVMSVTPGPNNLLFAAAGSRVGFLRSTPILAGMVAGFAGVIIACWIGIGAAIGDSTVAQVGLTALAAAYLAWLGLKLWRTAGAAVAPEPAAPVSWLVMAGLQGLNPKTWLASLAFASGFLGANSPGGQWSDVGGIAAFLAVVTCSASLWTLFGAAVRERLPRRWQVRWNRGLSVLALATALGLAVGVGA